jgi:hypothetical protein
LLANLHGVRNPTLHGLLEAFTVAAGIRLERAVAAGDEVPFDLVATAGNHRARPALYCYRPLTGRYIGERLELLAELPTFLPVLRTLAGVAGLELYLHAGGHELVPEQPREQAELVVAQFLARVFDERIDFEVDEQRFIGAYEELEQAIYQGRHVTEVAVALLGMDLDAGTDELALAEGVSLQRAGALAGAPAELAAGPQPPLLLVLRVAHERDAAPPVAFARARLRRVLTALRLFERGDFALGALGYRRVDGGSWTPVAIGAGGRSRQLTLIPRSAEDELRGFCNLIGRRLSGAAHRHGPDRSGAGELSWALARFEMGCERSTPYEALSDHLLALRALLEPEGPASGRLAQRLAMICASERDRAALAERTAGAIALERSVITGMIGEDAHCLSLVTELADNLRAILRDVICGHLDADLCTLADELIGQAADELDAVLA